MKLKRALAEQRKQEKERQVQRQKAQNRTRNMWPQSSPVWDFVLQKRAEFFMGLGTEAAVPLSLQFTGKVFNRCVWACGRTEGWLAGHVVALVLYTQVTHDRHTGHARRTHRSRLSYILCGLVCGAMQ